MQIALFALLLVALPPSISHRNQTEVFSQTSDNDNMTAIYIADQKARENPASIDWKVLWPADTARRVQTQALLDAGKLRSANDYYHAAYVFQHGNAAEDCLKAHAFAVIAVARGKAEATWIAAATLDRYLQRIGQPQIYGTQFSNPGQKWTQEPYRRDLLSDPVREASGVPPLARQEKQLKNYENGQP